MLFGRGGVCMCVRVRVSVCVCVIVRKIPVCEVLTFTMLAAGEIPLSKTKVDCLVLGSLYIFVSFFGPIFYLRLFVSPSSSFSGPIFSSYLHRCISGSLVFFSTSVQNISTSLYLFGGPTRSQQIYFTCIYAGVNIRILDTHRLGIKILPVCMSSCTLKGGLLKSFKSRFHLYLLISIYTHMAGIFFPAQNIYGYSHTQHNHANMSRALHGYTYVHTYAYRYLWFCFFV